MSDNDLTAFTTQATAAVQAAYEAGYKAGHTAAINAVMRAAQLGAVSGIAVQGVSHGQTSGMSGITQPIMPMPPHEQLPADDIPKTKSGRAAPGAIKRLVYEFVLSAGHPVTENDFAGRYPNIGRPSRYMAFRSLHGDQAIAKQGRSWVPALRGAGNPDAASSGSSQPQASGGTENAA
jgi:hypothetical protein